MVRNQYRPGDSQDEVRQWTFFGRMQRLVCWMTVLVLSWGGIFLFIDGHNNRPLMHFRIDLGDGREVLIDSYRQPRLDTETFDGRTTVTVGNHTWSTEGTVHVERLLEGE